MMPAFISISLAIAKINPNDTADNAFDTHSGWSHIDDAAELPIPVVGDRLFLAQSDRPLCLDREAVVDQFQLDVSVVGGQIIEIPRARAQAFADRWRHNLNLDGVNVTSILVHLFLDERKNEWTADLVELDEVGCAMSRTLLTVSALNDLLAVEEAAN